MKKFQFKKIADAEVRTVWKDDAGKLVYMFPCDIADTGIPIDEESGNECEYVRTEILTKTKTKPKKPDGVRKFTHKGGCFLDGDAPFKYVEIKDGKFYKVLKNGYRKELVGTFWRLNEVDFFVEKGYWIEVKR